MRTSTICPKCNRIYEHYGSTGMCPYCTRRGLEECEYTWKEIIFMISVYVTILVMISAAIIHYT